MESITQPTMQSEINRPQPYLEIFREIGSSAKDIIQSEFELIGAEAKKTVNDTKAYIAQAIVFGILLVISILPFLAFAVIGLGELLDGRYWLSSLIVAVTCAVIGGSMSFRAYKKIKGVDKGMSRTMNGIRSGVQSVQEKLEDVGQATKGENAYA